MMTTAPCDWPLEYVCEECDSPENLTDAQREVAERLAVEFLWNTTGQRYGLCEVTFRPCREDCATYARESSYDGRGPRSSPLPGQPAWGWAPVLIRGRWFNVSCGACLGERCSCAPSGPSVLRLPLDTREVREVVVDGVTLVPEAYALVGSFLVRRDGGTWPTCQDFRLPDGAPGTWSVTIVHGVPVPLGGQVAAAELATEFGKALCGDSTCRLPQRVQTITRAGVTVAVQDDFSSLGDGQTGIWTVDQWTASVRTPPPAVSRVRSVDLPRGGAR